MTHKQQVAHLLTQVPQPRTEKSEKPLNPTADVLPPDALTVATIEAKITDARRALLEVSSQLKNELTLARQEFNHESQRRAAADNRRDIHTNELTKRLDHVEAGGRRLVENQSITDEKLSNVAIQATSAKYGVETLTASLDATNELVSLLQAQVSELKRAVDHSIRQRLKVNTVLGCLGLFLLSIFGIYRVTATPGVAGYQARIEELEQQAEANQDSINSVIEAWNRHYTAEPE